MSQIAGIHPVREALLSGRNLDRVHIARGAVGARIQEIIDLCRERRIPIRFEPRAGLDRLVKDIPHQGVVALGAPSAYTSLEEALRRGGLLVVLDGVEDPHNFGAILRTAHAAGAAAVVVPERRAAGLTETVAKAAAGALSLINVVRVTNLNRAIEEMKKTGYWIYGVDERGAGVYAETEFTDPAAIVFGGEGHGLHEQIRRRCDFLLRIPLAGRIASLNVSVAAGVVLFEWRRRKGFPETSWTAG